MRIASNTLNILVLSALCLALQSFMPADSANSKLLQLKYQLFLANDTYPEENIYLQLDRPSYWANDDIWFKAYLQSVVDSSNIHVELINSSGKVVDRKLYMTFDGLAYGDIHLPDTISSGVYQLRAYTNWMRNFGEDGFFHKNFIIWNLKDREVPAQKEQLKRRDVDIRFFPEGGTFLAGVTNKLGFKAVDENGMGLPISGVIQDNDGQLICDFKSLFKGMGSVSFQPEAGKKYTAVVNVLGKTRKVNLPEPEINGVSLAIKNIHTDKVQIMVRASDSNPEGSTYFLVAQSRGKSIFGEIINLDSGLYTLNFPTDQLPAAVIQFTVFDSNLIPRCERLIFNNHPNYVHLQIKANKQIYKTREKVNVQIESLLPDYYPAQANLSMTAFSSEGNLKLEQYPNNILTYFLLTSAIKGKIEEPAYYFKDTTQATLQALDNLMLTQGWRRFTWKAILNNELPPLTYQHQSSICIQGNVGSRFLEKPLPNSEVTLVFDQMHYKYYQQTTNDEGQFLFDGFYFYDKTSILLSAKRENGSTNTWLNIDESALNSPVVTILPVDYVLEDEQKVNTTYRISVHDSSLIKRKWHVTDTILLDDIDIIGKKKRDITQDQSLFLLYSEADFTLNVKEDDYNSSDIFDMMQFRLPGVQIRYDNDFGSAPSIRLSGNAGPPLLLLDGFPIDAFTLASMPVSSFEKVAVMKMAIMYGTKGINGALLFKTRPGIKNVESSLPSGVEHITVQGYSVIRQFYSPNYQDQKHSIEKTDFRSTLYWHPNIWTNEDGKAQVSYYNSDQPGEVTIIIEGLTTDGRLCRGTLTYNVSY